MEEVPEVGGDTQWVRTYRDGDDDQLSFLRYHNMDYMMH